MKNRFGLIGTGISHSKSPALFSAAYSDPVLSYVLIDEETFVDALRVVRSERIDGVNVTTPFKDEAFKKASERDPLSERIEASNLLLFENEKIICFNTDYYGVKDSISEFGNDDFKTLIIGCGGAGRAAAVAAIDCGHRVTIANRSIEKATLFANKIGAASVELSEVSPILDEFHIIINTLSSKYTGVDFSLAAGKIIFDANYNPLSKCSGINPSNIYIPGEKWLINQAIPSFRIFTRKEPDINAMRLVVNI